MAQIQNTPFDKTLRHFKKKIGVTLRNLSPANLTRKKSLYPVLLNSIPKAGTHMLEEMLEVVPELSFAGKKTISCWESADAKTLASITRMRRGYFSLAHLPALPEVVCAVEEANAKVIFLIRDPRDVVLSFSNYVLHIDKTHMAHNYLASFDTEEEVIQAVIEGNKPGVANLKVLLEKFSGWEGLPFVLICKYEDFLSPSRGGDKKRQEAAIRRILQHIEVHPEESLISSMLDRLSSESSSTFNQGGARRWVGKFTETHKQSIKSLAGEWLIHYGYEKNTDW